MKTNIWELGKPLTFIARFSTGGTETLLLSLLLTTKYRERSLSDRQQLRTETLSRQIFCPGVCSHSLSRLAEL